MKHSLRPERANPVKLLATILWKSPEVLAEALERSQNLWGSVDVAGPDRPFHLTDYYEAEMGKDLHKRVVSFAPLFASERLATAKLAAIEIENALRGPLGRVVNLDVGYMDVHKVVLASIKYGGPKVHLQGGVYADVVCRYTRGRFHPFDWTFADFKAGLYDEELVEIRERYKAALRGEGAPPKTRRTSRTPRI
jgi:hypothetical protein